MGTFYAAMLGIKIVEAVGEKRVEEKHGFDEVSTILPSFMLFAGIHLLEIKYELFPIEVLISLGSFI